MSPEARKQSTSRAWDAVTPSLSQFILEAVSSMGFDRMTPVQASTLPLFMGNKDVVVEAVTGSGKTLAFLIPIIERLLRADEPMKKHHVGAIIVSPTRELATQIHAVLNSLLAFHAPSAAALAPPDDDMGVDPSPRPPPSVAPKIVSQLLLGGATTPAQDLSTFLRTSPNLLIATPGRLAELLSSPHVHVPSSTFEALVLDEADRLLDLGFAPDLSKILSRLPKQRRTGLFSASVSEAVDQLIRVGLRNPVRVSVRVKSALTGASDQRTPASLAMAYTITPPHHKLPTLIKLLENLKPTPQKTIVYVSTCAAVDYFQHILPSLLPSGNNTAFVPLHGKHPPSVRVKNFTRFTTSTTPAVLVTTDLAARGLDISAVDVVVQLDPPSDPKTFLHRCGRAGRAGRRGTAVVMLTPGHEEGFVDFLAVRKTPVVPLLACGLLKPRADVVVGEAEAAEAAAKIRAAVLVDRAICDKAQRAFVSWVRAYGAHVAASIFRVNEVNWDEMALGWGLLRMPRMPELKSAREGCWSGDARLGLSVDWEGFAYKDKVREKRRREEMVEGRPVRPVKKEGERLSWSDRKEAKDLREARREKKRAKREREREGKMTAEEKGERERLDEMIRAVKREHGTLGKGEDDEEFEGFGD